MVPEELGREAIHQFIQYWPQTHGIGELHESKEI